MPKKKVKPEPVPEVPASEPPEPGKYFLVNTAFTREQHARPYDPFGERLRALGGVERIPVTRNLQVYTQDPATPRLEVAVDQAAVPYEPLEMGPNGSVIRIIDTNETLGETYDPLDLDELGARAPAGVEPSTGNPHFAQQMTYAVAMVTYDRFRQALGRTPDFSFGPDRKGEPKDTRPREDGPGEKESGDQNTASKPRDGAASTTVREVKLHIYPHGMQEDNAYYDPERGALLFGYTFASKRATGMNQPGDVIYTSLSHDVVVHETTHALLDGMRSKFMLPSNPDVDAFHEAFADLVALFQRFQFRDLVKHGIAQSPNLDSRLLTDIARQWGAATGPDPRKALRSALVAAGAPDDPVPDALRYDKSMEAHDLGAVLVAAIFDAFRWIYGRKTRDLLAVGLRPGERMSSEMLDLLTAEAVRLSGQFLNIVIRAVDYCPPVDLTFGEYLRAMITADFDLVPEDPWGYREALVQAFRRYGIVVDRVSDLSEESLRWHSPEGSVLQIEALAFKNLRYDREPGIHAQAGERDRRARFLGGFVTQAEHLHRFGLARPVRGTTLKAELPTVESIRTIRRIGPDSTLNFDLVAEVTQRRKTRRGQWFYGGCTVIIDASGRVRYAIAKHVNSERRQALFEEHLAKAPAMYAKLFTEDTPRTGKLLRHLHATRA